MQHKLNKNIIAITLNLTIACVISGVIIAGTYQLTAATAKKRSIEIKNKSMKNLVTAADTFKSIKGKPDWVEAKKGNKTVAYIVPSESKGYGGIIRLLIAIDTNGKVIDYNVLDSKETPGLGDKASSNLFKDQYKGKTTKNMKIVKDIKNKENIQAISGATITSNAVNNGVREAVISVEKYLKGEK